MVIVIAVDFQFCFSAPNTRRQLEQNLGHARRRKRSEVVFQVRVPAIYQP